MNRFFSSRGFRESEIKKNENEADRFLKRRRKIVRDGRKPVLPGFCTIIRLMMFILPVLDAAVEAIVWLEGKVSLTFGMYLKRVFWSAFMIWLFFACILILLSVIMLYRAAYRGYEERVYLFLDEIPAGEDPAGYEKEYDLTSEEDTDESLVLYSRPADVSADKRYGGYIRESLTGLIILGVLYAVSHFFL
ncbi:MAG: hypothetical protein IJ930_05940 [Lachnospiraceae bacterium]|nr:hypothetical protein [Lachnospiraceae bacterium]